MKPRRLQEKTKPMDGWLDGGGGKKEAAPKVAPKTPKARQQIDAC